ncbi:LacI family DNA-binding transcriptional regulator [Rossellomorea marisflavi]|uniref:LacI family DNA-binding transcriptional regulator n=1 Tax=Rossellomorea marisflavi TaxID=189381 RepID=UPI0035144D13
MVTLKDVAKKASVSVSTASYAINGSTLITEETKNKVLKAAEEIGYRPNGMAKNLKKNKTEIIGLFISGFTGPFFNEMIEGIQDVVIEKGYELVVCASVDKHRLLVEKHVDGAIILNYHMDDALLSAVAHQKMPLVVMDRDLQHPFIQNVLLPNDRGMALAVKHFAETGVKDLGFIAGSTESYDGEARLEAFERAVADHGLNFDRQHLIRADFTEESGYEAMKEYLQSHTEYPRGFVSANDEMALGAMEAIQEKGLHIPGDLALVGFDDIYISKFVSPSLTTVNIPRKTWGEMAARTLFRMLDENLEFEEEELSISLKVRHSG